MTNIISCVKGDTLSFAVYHEVDGSQYTLSDGEKYRIKIKKRGQSRCDTGFRFVPV